MTVLQLRTVIPCLEDEGRGQFLPKNMTHVTLCSRGQRPVCLKCSTSVNFSALFAVQLTNYSKKKDVAQVCCIQVRALGTAGAFRMRAVQQTLRPARDVFRHHPSTRLHVPAARGTFSTPFWARSL